MTSDHPAVTTLPLTAYLLLLGVGPLTAWTAATADATAGLAAVQFRGA